MKYTEWKKQFVTTLDSSGPSGILLAEVKDAVIPVEKFTLYALDPVRQPDKARAFKLALGYTKENAEDLIRNIREHLGEYTAKHKGTNAFGTLYETTMTLKGPNGKTANVRCGWIVEKESGRFKLTSSYVTGKKVK